MSNQLQITGGAKVRNLNGVITGTTGVLGSVPLGAANGVATLDSGGKVPVSQLPSSVVTYLGTWNAATNTPTLVNGTGDAGDLYICNVAGTVNFGAGPISFVVGDWVLYGSGTWQKSSGQNGTVTSVAVTETGDALTITGSPITTAGTINIGFAGTSAQYVAGDGTLITFPSLTGYVPYTGATTDVDLGTHVLNAQALHVKGTAGAGHLGLKHQTATPTGSANESLIFADVNGNLGWQNDNLYLSTFVSNANTANRTYTLQNASGTLAFLSDIPSLAGYVTLATTQTISGTKTFTSTTTTSKIRVDNTLLSEGTTVAFKQYASGAIGETGYTSITAQGSNLFYINWGGTKSAILDSVNLTSDRTYTLPNADGTLALTSDIPSLTGYVTLATTQTITGAKTFNNNLYIDTNAYWTKMNPIAAISGTMNLYAPLGSSSSFVFLDGDSSKSARFNFDNTANRIYTFPAATGTIALTSDIPSLSNYVTLDTTQTISGTKTFSSDVFALVGVFTRNSADTFIGSSNNTSGIKVNGTTTVTKIVSGGNETATFASTGAATFSSSVTAASDYINGTIADNGTGRFRGSFSSVNTSSSLAKVQFGGGEGSQFRAYMEARQVWGGTYTDNELAFVVNKGGVGTTTALTLAGTGAATFSSTSGNSLTSTSSDFYASLTLQHSGGSNAGQWNLQSVSGAQIGATAGAAFGIYSNTASAYRLYINPSGNVGIGTSSPQGKLDITGTTSGDLLYLDAAINTDFAFKIVAAADDVLTLRRQHSTQGNKDIMSWGYSGNVGIGTTSPALKLDVVSTSQWDGIRVYNTSSAQGADIRVGNDANNNLGFLRVGGSASGGIYQNSLVIGTGGGYDIKIAPNGSLGLTVASGGSLLVGTTANDFGSRQVNNSATSYTYHSVRTGTGSEGHLVFSNANGAVGSIFTNGSSTSYNTSSDYRLKQDLKDFNGLSLISSIKTYNYEWKADNTRAFGVIAHELAEVLPYAVSGEKDGEQMQGVDYSKIVPVLVKAIQELSMEINELKAKLA